MNLKEGVIAEKSMDGTCPVEFQTKSLRLEKLVLQSTSPAEGAAITSH